MLKSFKQIVRVPIQRIVLSGHSIEVESSQFLSAGFRNRNPIPQWLISATDSERLVHWGKRDVSQECDNPYFPIRFPNTALPNFFFLTWLQIYLLSLIIPLNVIKWVLYSFVPRMWRIQNPRFVYFMGPQHFVHFSLLPQIMMCCNYLCTSASLNNDLLNRVVPYEFLLIQQLATQFLAHTSSRC